jgi:hypothetical protein
MIRLSMLSIPRAALPRGLLDFAPLRAERDLAWAPRMPARAVVPEGTR